MFSRNKGVGKHVKVLFTWETRLVYTPPYVCHDNKTTIKNKQPFVLRVRHMVVCLRFVVGLLLCQTSGGL